MEGSQMTGINLRVATLKNAKLKNCNLRGATLAGTDLEVRVATVALFTWTPFCLNDFILIGESGHCVYMNSK